MSDRVLRMMRAKLNGANFQTMKFEGRDHLVVPVVLMVGDIVVYPMHTEGGEFVPAKVLAEAPKQWDGRPVVPDHPEGGTASANEPKVLESQRFGVLFNSRFDDGRLKSQAWIDPLRAAEVGPDAVDVVERLQRGEVIEISIGAWVTLTHKTGSAGGQKFRHQWTNVASDHLAMLPSDDQGACSVDAGCGASPAHNAQDNRAGKATLRAAKEEVSVKWTAKISRVLEALGLKASQESGDESVSELMNALHQALRREEPAFESVVEVFLDTSTVVYAASPEGPIEFFMRKYSMDDGEITLDDERVAVEPRTTFVPLSSCDCKDDSDCTCDMRHAAEGQSDNDLRELLQQALTASELDASSIWIEAVFPDLVVFELREEDGPSKTFEREYAVEDDSVTLGDERREVVRDVSYRPVAMSTNGGSPPEQKGAAQMNKLTKLAARIIGCEASPFKEGDEEQLIAFGEERLVEMADAVEKEPEDSGDDSKGEGDEQDGSPNADAGANDDDDDADKGVTVSQGDYDEMRDALAERRAARESRQKALATKIIAKTDVYIEGDLLKRPVEELAQLAKALGCDDPVRDFSGKGTPIHEDDESVPPPPDQATYARALKAGKSREEAMDEARKASTTH